jgi:hypothetical protein
MCDVARTETEMETDGEREIQRGGGKGEMGLNCLVVSSNSLVVQFGGSRIGMVGEEEEQKRRVRKCWDAGWVDHLI